MYFIDCYLLIITNYNKYQNLKRLGLFTLGFGYWAPKVFIDEVKCSFKFLLNLNLLFFLR